MNFFAPDDMDRFAALYPNVPGKLSHRLLDHELLALEALVGLAGRLDPGNVEYNAGDLPIGVDPQDVPHTGLSPQETIRRIEECGSWMVLKNVNEDPAYGALLEQILAELAAAVEPVSGKMLTKLGFIFISSPGAVTPFHMDPEHNVLLQIRGSKKMTIFPGDETIVPAEKHEAYHVGGHRNLDWRDEFMGHGEIFDLQPGDAVHVPVKRPHWVKNGDAPSISFSITWRSQWSYEEADARGLNHLLRSAGLEPASPAQFPERNVGKSLAFRAIRRARALGK
ncbi:transcriptional regulator [Sphingosinicella rhizophila]|uniref:Transcriptional regulator n=1 Tax=Sphingosinicella rhizophila TaxID=3050082 RepID=A0ABU3QAM0_9SPHN|nr:transcriptional regulator [Sphingosinicella sp. GR2756]MDT9600453.1 transcriptional regulator [Sphingosinicella sp. GR2756]